MSFGPLAPTGCNTSPPIWRPRATEIAQQTKQPRLAPIRSQGRSRVERISALVTSNHYEAASESPGAFWAHPARWVAKTHQIALVDSAESRRDILIRLFAAAT